MGIKEDYQQAISLAKQGKYEQARSLLIAYDHPKTEALLKRINQSILSERGKPSIPKKQSVFKQVLGILAIAFLLCAGAFAVLYVGINWNWWFGTGKQELSAFIVCTYVTNNQGKPCDDQYLIDNHMDALTSCLNIHGRVSMDARPIWAICLEREGAVFAGNENRSTMQQGSP